MKGEHIHVLEKGNLPGGACDGYKFENLGYVDVYKRQGAHRADDHHEHAEELHPRDGKARIVHLRRPEVRHKDGRPREAGREAEVEVNAGIDLSLIHILTIAAPFTETTIRISASAICAFSC